MRYENPHTFFATVLLLLALALPGCSGASTQSDGAGDTGASTPSPDASAGATAEGKRLVLERCTRCHDVTRIKQANKDEGEWRATVARMRENGAEVDDSEAETIVRFLAGGGAKQL